MERSLRSRLPTLALLSGLPPGAPAVWTHAYAPALARGLNLAALLLAGAGIGLAFSPSLTDTAASAATLLALSLGAGTLGFTLRCPPPGLAADTGADQPGRDELTGLPTHLGLRERLQAALGLSCRQGAHTGVLVLDIRYFREVNERLGRAGGDQVLRMVAQRLRLAVRREDLVARLGSNRFLVVQTDLLDPAHAVGLAERLATAMKEPLVLNGQAVQLEPDIGVAIGPEDGCEAEQLLAHAEDALATARSAPCPTIQCFAPEQDSALRHRRQTERELREAIAEGSFVLHWQPQRRLTDRRLIGFEALLRWRHPTRGLLPPAAFIPLAEESRLIEPLGNWVIRTATAEAASWPEELKIAVNLSAAQLRSEALVPVVREALASSGLAPQRLQFEVTESLLVRDAQQAVRAMEALRALGCTIALDDFGTGWSSLAYLRRLPFDEIKMDRAFLRDLDTDPRVGAIVDAILRLGHSLGLPVMAEGIETEDQARRLLALGCDRGQGWLLGSPVPPEEARALIAAGAADTSLQLA